MLVRNQKSLDYVGLIDGIHQPSDGYYLGVFPSPGSEDGHNHHAVGKAFLFHKEAE